jgi:hypothetical protein
VSRNLESSLGNLKSVEDDNWQKNTKKLMGVRNWKRAAQYREEWRGLIREAKARNRAVTP